LKQPDKDPDRPVPGPWRRDTSAGFVYSGFNWMPDQGRLDLHYALDAIPLTESFVFPVSGRPDSFIEPALNAAFELLHWVAGISYWKAGCPTNVVFHGRSPDPWQAEWLNGLFREGLAEFAYRQQLNAARFAVFVGQGSQPPPASSLPLDEGALVPMGGGKDSLVAWERLDRKGLVAGTVQIGQSTLISEVARRVGSAHWQVRRQVDPKLAALNEAGAFNGHVPITAINAAALVVFALLRGHGAIAFANERSADEPTLTDHSGQPVNHQFSKSLRFERMLDAWVRHYIAANLSVFSMLRRDRELGVCQAFAELERFHDVFSSCNRNFHLDGPRTQRWCGHCPKCHFVFLALAPFLPPEKLTAIFGRDLLDEPAQVDGFAHLLGLDGEKPFECVGEADEARAAIQALAEGDQWCNHRVVEALSPRLQGLQVPRLADLCRPGGPHLIPEALLDEA
jgi:hypothetical protein